jgi:hypothetical protein
MRPYSTGKKLVPGRSAPQNSEAIETDVSMKRLRRVFGRRKIKLADGQYVFEMREDGIRFRKKCSRDWICASFVRVRNAFNVQGILEVK